MRMKVAPLSPALSGIQISSAYQPIVDLWTGEVVAFEALARGPVGTDLESPDQLFAHARATGELSALDWLCRATAVAGAIEAGLGAPIRLFVNAEPEAMSQPCPPELRSILGDAPSSLRPVLEVTERALTRDPAGLLAAVDRARRSGWGIALDDVGADPASLALMPFLAPDVIKLDLSLVRERTNAQTAEIANAVLAYAERTGAVILAEGIENDEHRHRALALGASLGQGWLFGRPGPLPANVPAPREPMRRLPDIALVPSTPFRLVAGRHDLRTATKDLLLPLSHHLERQALRAAEPPVLLAAFEHADHFTPATRRRYTNLARHCSFVAALGVDMTASPTANVRGADLHAGDALAGEWVVTCVGPHFAGALIAKDLGDTGPDRDRRFRYVVTYDRDTVVAAARSLLAKVVHAEQSTTIG